MKNALGILLGGLLGISLLYFIEKLQHQLGFLGGIILLFVLILAPMAALMVDYFINRASTFLKRFLICTSISLIVLGYNFGSRSEIARFDVSVILVSLLISVPISALLSKVLKY